MIHLQLNFRKAQGLHKEWMKNELKMIFQPVMKKFWIEKEAREREERTFIKDVCSSYHQSPSIERRVKEKGSPRHSDPAVVALEYFEEEIGARGRARKGGCKMEKVEIHRTAQINIQAIPKQIQLLSIDWVTKSSELGNNWKIYNTKQDN